MHKNYKVDEHVITNIILRHIKPTESHKQIKLIIYFTKYKTSNLIVRNNTNSPNPLLTQTNVAYKFTCPFRECFSENNITPNIYIGYTTTTLSCRLTYHLTDISAIKQHIMTKHNKDTDKLKSPNLRKILINNIKIIYKNNYKERLQILEAITIKNTINKIAFTTSIKILNVFNN